MPKQRNLLTSSIGNSISYFFEIKLPKAAIDSDNSAEIFEQWTQSNLVESIARIN